MGNAEFDIDLSGEDEFKLPTGVQQGSLGGDEGSDIPPPKPGEFLTDPEEDEEDLPWNGNSNPAPEDATPVETPAPREETPKPKPKPKAKKRAPRKEAQAPAPAPVSVPAPTPKPASSPASDDGKKTSGTIDRPYRIFQIKPADVDGQIIDVPVPVIFNSDDGGTQDTIVARNRDLALQKAAKAFGPGWSGTLVAVPIGMWEEKPIFNKPRNSFSVQIGNE